MATLLWWTLLAASASAAAGDAAAAAGACDISEFRCAAKGAPGSLCLPMDRWCNGRDDCENRVDEPRSCSSTLSTCCSY